MKTKHAFYISWLILLVLASCGTQNDTLPSPGVETTVPILTVTTIVNAESTPSPTVVSRPTPTLTLTPIPTLAPETALEVIEDLIEKGDECILPCWLGMVPGQTRFNEVENTFLQYSAIAFTEFSSKDAYLRVFFPNFEEAIHDAVIEVFSAQDGVVSHIVVDAGMNPDENGKYNYGNLSYQKIWQRHFLPGIFAEHGIPGKIFLDTTLLTVDPATSYPYAIWIVYPQKGFLLRYGGVNIKDGENIKICPMQSSIGIIMWDFKKIGYEEFIENDGAGGISLGPQPIETVTDFDIEAFFEVFQEGKLDTCFTTPASHWPPN